MKSLLLSCASVVLISGTLLFNIYDSLSISQDDARSCLVASIGFGLMSTPGHPDIVRTAKQLSSEEKVAGIRELMHLAKEYTATAEFQKDYKKWRQHQLNPDTKSKLGVPKLGKMLDRAMDNQLDKAKNEKLYPSDPAEAVKQRLKDFLEVSSDVDFDAEVVNGEFVKSEYKKKSPAWKQCFRAGKPVVMAAREEAETWLKELEK